MSYRIDEMSTLLLSWGAWLIIPCGWEFIKGILCCFVALVNFKRSKPEPIDFYPTVTILVPVYNSMNTLQACLDSINDQSYPIKNIEVFLIDNGSLDNPFELFQRYQDAHPRLRIFWYTSKKGKANALNKGIYASNGKYIINIDSDGWLDKDAIRNIVIRFEKNREIACMTGVVMIDHKLIANTKSRALKTLQKCEFFEYTDSFVVGRSVQSAFDNLYTLAGAFSCFRKEAILKTQLYNADTLGEDTHMTFQIRKFVGGRIVLCNDAYFFVDPIESLDKLYTQRQRWQRSEIEVANMFTDFYTPNLLDIVKKSTMRTIVSDHSLLFAKLIWMFAALYLIYDGYSLAFIVGGNGIMYLIYCMVSFAYLNVSALCLRGQRENQQYLYKNWYICFLMPIYRTLTYLIRLAGTINSVSTTAAWKTKTLSEELLELRSMFRLPKNEKKQTTKFPNRKPHEFSSLRKGA